MIRNNTDEPTKLLPPKGSKIKLLKRGWFHKDSRRVTVGDREIDLERIFMLEGECLSYGGRSGLGEAAIDVEKGSTGVLIDHEDDFFGRVTLDDHPSTLHILILHDEFEAIGPLELLAREAT